MTDDEVIRKAYDERWVLITNDKDFGQKVYRENRPHCGIILMRLEDERANNKINVLRRLLKRYPDKLADRLIVVTETQVRFAQTRISPGS
jgi:predicted nuclease of predicted toxin-antitoxin system